MRWLPRNRTSLITLALALVVGALAVWGFRTSPSAVKARERDARLEAALEAGPSGLAPTLEVEVETVRAVAATDVVELSAVLEPVRATWVAAEIAGRIVEVPAREFAPIREGDLLVRLDDALPRAELIRAEASHRLAGAELERQERLEGRSVASEAELDAARAEERRSWAALLEARTRLAHTRIKAPFDGLVNVLDLDPGAYVQPGTPIAEILDLSVLEMTVLVGDRQVGALAPGQPARVRVDALGNAVQEGRIARIGGAPRAGSQRYPVVVSLPVDASDREAAAAGGASRDSDSDAGKVRPGMLAHVQLEVGKTEAIRVPSRALIREFELDYVFVIEEGDVAKRVRVATRPVPFRPDRVEITSGLDAGARIAVNGVDQLRTGLRVIVR